MTTRLKKESGLPVPQSKEAAEELARAMVEDQLEAERLVADRDSAVLKATEPFAGKIETLEAENKLRLAALEIWAQANESEFGSDKSLSLGGHRVGWRTGQPTATTMSKWTWKKVMANLLEQPKRIRDLYVRIKEEPNKEAFIARREDHPDELKALGVRIVQTERFYLEPDREGQDSPLLTS